jgi:hypothetical protein
LCRPSSHIVRRNSVPNPFFFTMVHTDVGYNDGMPQDTIARRNHATAWCVPPHQDLPRHGMPLLASRSTPQHGKPCHFIPNHAMPRHNHATAWCTKLRQDLLGHTLLLHAMARHSTAQHDTPYHATLYHSTTMPLHGAPSHTRWYRMNMTLCINL